MEVGNQSEPHSVTIFNNGDVPVGIDAIADSGNALPDELSIFGVPGSFSIPEHGAMDFQIAFAPSGDGPFEHQLYIYTKGGTASASLMVTALGNGINETEPLSVSPTDLRFGDVVAGETSAPKKVKITNRGNEAVRLDAIGGEKGFLPSYLLADGFAQGMSLAPRKSTTIDLRYAPGKPGDHSGDLHVFTPGGVSSARFRFSGSSLGLM